MNKKSRMKSTLVLSTEFKKILKVGLSLSKKIGFICFIKSPLK